MVRDKRGAIKISHVACIGCGHCLAICPEGAISLREIEYEGSFAPLTEPAVAPEGLLHLLQHRRTVRRYTREPVRREHLERLIEAARWVPTAANCQCQQFVVLTDAGKLDRLREGLMGYYRRYAEALARGVTLSEAEPSEGPSDAGGASSPAPQAPQHDNPRSRVHEHILAAVPSFVKHVDAGRDRLFFAAPAVILIHAASDEILPEAACAFATLAVTLMAETLGLGTCITAYASLGLQALPELAREAGVPEGHGVYYVVVVGHPAEQYQLIPPRKPAEVTWDASLRPFEEMRGTLKGVDLGVIREKEGRL
jgi:nitroreductase